MPAQCENSEDVTIFVGCVEMGLGHVGFHEDFGFVD